MQKLSSAAILLAAHLAGFLLDTPQPTPCASIIQFLGGKPHLCSGGVGPTRAHSPERPDGG